MLSIGGSTTFKISISLSKIMLCFTSLHFAFLIITSPDSGRNLQNTKIDLFPGLLSIGDTTQLHRCPLADLAFKKSTAQSSTDSNGFSGRAVDENLGPYYSSKSCTHTKKETNPWWRVDLGREYIVTGSLWIESIFQKLKDHRSYVSSSSNCREPKKCRFEQNETQDDLCARQTAPPLTFSGN